MICKISFFSLDFQFRTSTQLVDWSVYQSVYLTVITLDFWALRKSEREQKRGKKLMEINWKKEEEEEDLSRKKMKKESKESYTKISFYTLQEKY